MTMQVDKAIKVRTKDTKHQSQYRKFRTPSLDPTYFLNGSFALPLINYSFEHVTDLDI